MTRVLTYFLTIVAIQALFQQAVAQLTLVNVGNTNIGAMLDLQVSGNYAFLANGYAGMRICDISNPTNPISVGTVGSLGYPRALTISDSHVFLVGDGSLDIYDISNPTDPVSVASTNIGGYQNDVAVSGSYLYVPRSSLSIFDVSDPTYPLMTGNVIGGGSYSIVVSKDFAYVSNPNSGHTLFVYDVHNPYAPTNVYASAGAYVWGLAISSNYLFAASQSFIPVSGGYVSGVLTFDISNPTNPVYAATTGDSISAGARLVAKNGFVYLIDYMRGLTIYDASNPTNLVDVGNIMNSGSAWSVAVSGCYAYVGGTDGLHINAIIPRLEINLLAPDTLRLSWLAPAFFTVQQNDSPSSTNWIALTNTPSVFGTRAQFDIPRPTGNKFYRLVSR